MKPLALGLEVRVTASARPGQNINAAAAAAIDLAARLDCQVSLTHNGTEVLVHPDDSEDLVVRHWDALRTQEQRRRLP